MIKLILFHTWVLKTLEPQQKIVNNRYAKDLRKQTTIREAILYGPYNTNNAVFHCSKGVGGGVGWSGGRVQKLCCEFFIILKGFLAT